MDKIPMVVKIVDLHSLNRNHLYKVRVWISSDQLLLQCLFNCSICCKCCPWWFTLWILYDMFPSCWRRWLLILFLHSLSALVANGCLSSLSLCKLGFAYFLPVF
jgi:hypothetical protein